MNMERAAMRGQLAEQREKRDKLRLRIEGNCVAVRQGLNCALVDVADLNVPLVAEQMDELELAWAELIAVNLKIERLERELD